MRIAAGKVPPWRVWRMPAEASQALAGLAARSMQLQCTVQDGQIWLSDAKETVQLELTALQTAL